MLKGKKILIGITGSIAAYKIVELVRLLMKANAEVKIVMTPSATLFVSPLVLSTLSKNKVYVEMFEENTWSNHVALGRWADVFLIAPLSCNTLSKMANGSSDNFLLAVYMSATCPVVFAPAMDEDMWKHPATQKNIATLCSWGHKMIAVEVGELASGLFGAGRMASVETLYYALLDCCRAKRLAGKNILITAGATQEPIDPVRYISNYSSGKMGVALAEALCMEGANVTLITGVMQVQTQMTAINIVPTQTAEEMYTATLAHFNDCHVAILAAAVADYKPAETAVEKIKKTTEDLQISLVKNKDILATLGSQKKASQTVVGFALESNNEKENARKKLTTKKADFIVLNSIREKGAGFATDTNKVIIFDKEGNEYPSDLLSKKDIAYFIMRTIGL